MSSNPTRAAPAASTSPVRYQAAAAEPVPPVAPASPAVTTIHGESRIDEYAWLRDRDDPRVLAYLEAENAYTQSVMRRTEGLQERLYQEMRGRIKETDLSVPTREDGWLYYTRTETGGQYPIFCRRRDQPDSPEEVLLDQNALAAGHAYYRLGAFEVSPDHRLLAYSVDTSGAESFTLVVKDLVTGELFPESIGNTSPTAAWANDSRTLFYVVLDQARRPCSLYRHVVDSDPAAGQPAPAREGRILLPRHRPDSEQAVSGARPGEPLDVRGAGRARRRAGRTVPGHRAPPSWNRIQRDPSRRPVLHRDQRRCAEFPSHVGAGGDALARALARGAALPAGGQDRFGGCLPRPPRGMGARVRVAPDPHHRARRCIRTPGAVPRAGLHRPIQREPRVRHQSAPLQLHLAGHAELRRGLRHGGAHLDDPEADGSARRVRPESVSERAPAGHRAGRREGAGLAGLPAAAGARRRTTAAPHGLWRVRHELRSRVLFHDAQPARSRVRVRDRAHPRRRGARPSLVRRRETAAEAEQLHRLHRGGGASGRRGVYVALSGSRSTAAARAGS